MGQTDSFSDFCAKFWVDPPRGTARKILLGAEKTQKRKICKCEEDLKAVEKTSSVNFVKGRQDLHRSQGSEGHF